MHNTHQFVIKVSNLYWENDSLKENVIFQTGKDSSISYFPRKVKEKAKLTRNEFRRLIKEISEFLPNHLETMFEIKDSI